MKQPRFAAGAYYHVYNRGVDKREIFLDEEDHLRFIHDLFEFNDADAVITFPQRISPRRKTLGGETSKSYRGPRPGLKKRKLLVDIIAWALMPNHYHLLLRQRIDGGTSLYMKKIGTGYTLYFNQKHERNGVLFQGTFRAKPITEDRYLRHLVSYIHANPRELSVQRSGKDSGGPLSALGRYRWSSYLDYVGIANVPSILNQDLIQSLGLPRGEDQRSLMREWIARPKTGDERFTELLFDESLR